MSKWINREQKYVLLTMFFMTGFMLGMVAGVSAYKSAISHAGIETCQ